MSTSDGVVRCAHRPNYGGNFCSGSNRQYQTCSNVPCPGRLTYRDEQCKLKNTGFQAFYPSESLP